MSDPNFVILYVENATARAAFYADLLGKPPVQASPGFALFALESGVMLGLWGRHDVAPVASAPPGGGEIAFSVADAAAVRATHADWQQRKLPILQPPVDLSFGHTFVALDPDGHRLRVFAPAAQ